MHRRRTMPREAPEHDELSDLIRSRSHPLEVQEDLTPLIDRIGDARYVLLGEASHGTSEYYTWRAMLSQRLIEEKGFRFIAVEGDWPDCYEINRYIRHAPGAGGSALEALQKFRRWPTWMWANAEVEALATWLREYNGRVGEDRQVGFYGLDVYSLWDSLYAVMGYLRRVDPGALPAALRAYRCFEPYGEDVQRYAHATALVPTSCEDEVVSLLRALREKAPRYEADGREAYFQAEQNGVVLKNAESYYRAMVRGGAESWNVRDRHMAETLDRLVRHHGPGAKAIVWEHNTHVGDARFTDMADEGMVNVGQLVRAGHGGEGVVLVGFGSYQGEVVAGERWEAPMEEMRVPPARSGSWEDIFHQAGAANRLVVFDDPDRFGPMAEWRGHRAIGVVYHPEYEHLGNYVPTVLPRRYDAFLYLERTRALHPLHVRPELGEEVPETYPSGV